MRVDFRRRIPRLDRAVAPRDELAGVARSEWDRDLERKESPAKMEHDRECALARGSSGTGQLLADPVGEPGFCHPASQRREAAHTDLFRSRERKTSLAIGSGLCGAGIDPAR